MRNLCSWKQSSFYVFSGSYIFSNFYVFPDYIFLRFCNKHPPDCAHKISVLMLTLLLHNVLPFYSFISADLINSLTHIIINKSKNMFFQTFPSYSFPFLLMSVLLSLIFVMFLCFFVLKCTRRPIQSCLCAPFLAIHDYLI